MITDRSLLSTCDEDEHLSQGLRSCLNAHGQYSTLRFVLRLSPTIHRTLSETPSGIYDGSEISFDQVQAYSTLLHETIHWWQHIGSTAGLVLSLSHPVQSHSNITHLKSFLREIGPKKSILRFASNNGSNPNTSKAGSEATNIAVNNFKDVGFYQVIATRPELIRTNKIAEDPVFVSVGHSYFITYANTLRLLRDLFDPQSLYLPDPGTWLPEFEKLRTEKVEGFYPGSPIGIPPVGLWQIFEGQARFIQLQYLHFGSGAQFDWDEARDLGMFAPVYVEAFETFLELTETEWPDSIDSPAVGLFLAICDMALNPGEGFPLPLASPQTFISDNDPGTRFAYLCRVVALRAPQLKNIITDYSADEYVEVTEALSHELRTPTPLDIAQTVTSWAEEHEELLALMDENRTFRFKDIDLPARLLFARYVAFSRDKRDHPEVFCWPGAWFAGKRGSEEHLDLLLRNQALFGDKEDDDSIFPRDLPDRDPTIVHETFNKFYNWIVSYDLITQWIGSEGPFRYDYEWLSTAHNKTEVEDWANKQFEHLFGVHPSRFEII